MSHRPPSSSSELSKRDTIRWDGHFCCRDWPSCLQPSHPARLPIESPPPFAGLCFGQEVACMRRSVIVAVLISLVVVAVLVGVPTIARGQFGIGGVPSPDKLRFRLVGD